MRGRFRSPNQACRSPLPDGICRATCGGFRAELPAGQWRVGGHGAIRFGRGVSRTLAGNSGVCRVLGSSGRFHSVMHASLRRYSTTILHRCRFQVLRAMSYPADPRQTSFSACLLSVDYCGGTRCDRHGRPRWPVETPVAGGRPSTVRREPLPESPHLHSPRSRIIPRR